ncbi:fimbrial protein [Serratia nevei]|uniref:fimbrial protein n=1 Tax=Serratia TaxID=613 RepID=UPI0018D8B753|nr:fimbrial protein [Serratia marcescens]MBH2871190.1 fimbrial protein [Serratia marcescens]MBI6126337.1 fimbrial protein [Serratia marcescens]MBN5185115.1 fimbrial protein [Serratia marcescens]MBN5194905.1 fimbrial protein [Serratia marcescens]MBN5301074.1 fimbrial protein [Serratia marcescens]
MRWIAYASKAGLRGIFLSASALTILALSAAAQANTTITVSGSVINPASCVINDNQTINVEFGNDVITTRVDTDVYGSSYLKSVVYTLQCKNASKVRMKVEGNTAPFNNKILKTEQNDLGVALRIGDSLMAVNSTVYQFDYPNSPQLVALPVKRLGGLLSAGEFNAGATMVLSFP